MIKMRDLIKEMPHVDNVPGSFDLCVEKYNISMEDKKRLMSAFYTDGVYGYSKEMGSWILLQQDVVKRVPKPLSDNILPDNWETYIVGDISL